MVNCRLHYMMWYKNCSSLFTEQLVRLPLSYVCLWTRDKVVEWINLICDSLVLPGRHVPHALSVSEN